MKAVSNIQELIRVIGASNSSLSSAGSGVVELKTWDGRVVRGSNYKGLRGADVISIITPSIDSNLLRPHVRDLLNKGKSFIVKKGQSKVEWTMSRN